MENGPLDAFLRVSIVNILHLCPMLLVTAHVFFNYNSRKKSLLLPLSRHLKSFRRTRASSASSSLLACSGELVQGCVTSLRETLSTVTWQPETCWSTPTWSVRCLTLACPDSWGAWTTTYLRTLPHWYVLGKGSCLSFGFGFYQCPLDCFCHCPLLPSIRAVRFLWGGQRQKLFSIASSARPVMPGASAYLCGKLCHTESAPTGTWAIKKWVWKRIYPEQEKP